MKTSRVPLFAALLGGALGAAGGLFWFWREAHALVSAVAKARVAEAKEALPQKPWDFWTLEIDNLSNELKEAKARLARREEELARSEARLAAERTELEQVRVQIENQRAAIAERLIEVQADELRNLKTLAQTYGNMTPVSALAILREMDDFAVVKLLAFMKPEEIAAIFEQMGQAAVSDPALAKRAAVLSERLRFLRQVRTSQIP
jgi:flagellar motility protein MotE (MotC chaperone)